MSSCPAFCATNPNEKLCLADCRRGLRAVPISKREATMHKFVWGPLALVGGAAAGVALVALYSRANKHR